MARKFFLAAGHGGGDPGSAYNNWKEADATVLVVDKTIELLKSQDMKGVELVKVPNDLGLQGAIDWINKQPNGGLNDWCLELHFNATANAPNARGTEIIRGKNSVGMEFGNKLKEGWDIIGNPWRRFIDNESKVWSSGQVGFGFINFTEPLAAIFEVDFISNPEVAAILNDTSRRDIFAKGLASAILKTVGSSYQEQPQPTPPTPIPPSLPVDNLYRVTFQGRQLGAFEKNPIEKINELEGNLTTLAGKLKTTEENYAIEVGKVTDLQGELTTVRDNLRKTNDALVKCQASQSNSNKLCEIIMKIFGGFRKKEVNTNPD